MSDTSLTVAEPRQAAPIPREYVTETRGDKAITLTRKNRAAIHAMVWQGLKRKDAAQHAGLTEHALYVALSKPHVKAYYMQQLDVLRTSERARNIHTLAEVRDQTSNQMARVAAAKALEQIDDTPAQRVGNAALPGITVIIHAGHDASVDTPHMHTIDHNPLTDKDGG